MVPGADKALQSLAALYPVAVLSGRDLADIHSRVGIPGLWYAGSHGFEMVAPDGTHHQNETAAAAVPVLEQAAAELTARAGATSPESWWSTSDSPSRCTTATPPRRPPPKVTATVHGAGGRHGLRVTSGRKVVELRPNLDWDKGKTLEWILDQIAGQEPLLPIYLGDDLTDEDALRLGAARRHRNRRPP